MLISSVRPGLLTALRGNRTYSEDWKIVCVFLTPTNMLNIVCLHLKE